MPDSSVIVFLDNIADGQVSENEEIVAQVTQRFDALRAEALPAGASRDLIRKLPRSNGHNRSAGVAHIELQRLRRRSVRRGRAVPGAVLVRDSKDPDGPRLAFSRQAWEAFAARVKAG